MSKFRDQATFSAPNADWALLPFRFERMGRRVLITNFVGEHLFLSEAEFALFTELELPDDSPLVRRLRAKHLIREPSDDLPLELLALKARTRYRRLAEFTSLHIFVASLRCEHSCPYCQVSRQSSDKAAFDMTIDTARLGLDCAFRSPSQNVKIEFQGGEPLLNFELVEAVVLEAKARNEVAGKNLGFVIATNLALLDGRVIDFCRLHDIYISTSLDGPADLHNKNRPRPGRNSWDLATAGIRRVREELGIDRVSALMTTTRSSLDRVRAIIDTYVDQGLSGIFLRPLSPYGFAIKTKSFDAYEQYAAVVLKKMFTNDDPGYVDLTSPAGIGIGAIVYNYDGDVYASDEGRMLAEMGDTTFRLGNLHADSYEEIMLSEALLAPLEQSFAASAPMCTDCAFEPYCGADPTYHHATAGDFLGQKPSSGFCRRNMAIFKLLLERYESDAETRALFRTWASH
jgi:radical SAM protein with 4Fe4S-binding SPASM domain